MPIINITSLDHPGVEVFSSLTEAQLRSGRYTDKEIFIAESPKVIHVALNAGYRATALLCERRHIDGDAAAIISRIGDEVPVYTGDRELLASLTGYTLTRGVLCAMERPALPTIADICRTAHRIAVIHGVVDTTNIGAIFRSAAALGIDAIALTTDSCDPLNRRSVRVSMEDVASSRMSIGGCVSMTRAMQSNCFCPWLRLSSERTVSSPCGRRRMKLQQWERLAA